MNDLEILVAMLARANIGFKVDNDNDWTRRIVLDGDRALVFDKNLNLCGIRSHNDHESFDGDQ